MNDVDYSRDAYQDARRSMEAFALMRQELEHIRLVNADLLAACEEALRVACEAQKWVLDKDWFDHLQQVCATAISKATVAASAGQEGRDG